MIRNFALAALVAAGLGATAASAETIKLGNVAELSGSGATVGKAWTDAITMGVEEINAAGGVLGNQLAAQVRRRLGPRWLSSTSCSRPRAIRSEVMVVTDPGLMLSLRATSMRGICPFARTCSNTCWRSGRVSSCGKASSGPQPEDTSFDPSDPRSRISSLAKLYPPDVF